MTLNKTPKHANLTHISFLGFVCSSFLLPPRSMARGNSIHFFQAILGLRLDYSLWGCDGARIFPLAVILRARSPLGPRGVFV